MLLTFSQLKNSRVPKRLGYCPEDPRFREDYNFTQEQLLNHGRWSGCVVQCQFCVDSLGCVVLPRNVAAVEQWAVSGAPASMQNNYWSFIRYVGQIPTCGACGNKGSQSGCSCGSLYAVQSGTSPLSIRMQSVPGPRYVKLYPRSATDIGKKVLIQGYDQNSEWVRRAYNGVFVDGEYVTLGLPFALTTSQYTAITGAQKDITDQPVLVYSFNPVDSVEVKLGEWDSDEVNPSNPVMRMPGAFSSTCSSSTCKPTVDAIVKLAHIPIRQDTDWLLIGNLVAIEHAMRGAQHYQANRDTEGDKEMVRAIAELNHELRTNTGNRQTIYADAGTIRTNIRTFSGFR